MIRSATLTSWLCDRPRVHAMSCSQFARSSGRRTVTVWLIWQKCIRALDDSRVRRPRSLQRRDPRQFGEALGAGQGDELSYIRGVGTAVGGCGIELSAQAALANGPGHDIAALDIVAHRPGR